MSVQIDKTFAQFNQFGFRAFGATDEQINPEKHYAGLTFDPQAVGVDPGIFADIWKLSAAVDFHFTNCSAVALQASEDGQDLNRNSNSNVFEGGVIECGHAVAVTCKGGSSFNEWRNVVIRGRGKHCEIEFGNHSAQSFEKCRGNRLVNVTHEDGKPVRVAYGRSEKPVIFGGNCVIVRPWSLALWAYTLAKHYLPFIP